MKILIIEDEKTLNESIVFYLKNEGFVCETVLNYSEASQKINDYFYDVVVIDILLPDGNGLDIIRELKANNHDSGIIIISAKNSLEDKLTGLDLGADDYITKPFHLAELNSRIKSVIRRRKFKGNKEIVFNEIRINPETAEVAVNNQIVNLTKKEYDLLLFFISNKNRVLTKETIAEHLWGDNIDLVDSLDFIFSHIKNLRKKIETNGGKNYIQTIYGMGYKFIDL
jgi:DNA-binding response OmpR family regulator